MYNPMNDIGARHPRNGHFDDASERMPRRHFHHDDGDFRTSPRDFDDNGPRCMPRGHGRHDFGPGNPGGMPPRRPDPQFLKRRIEDSDLMELIDMAGRMVQRRPEGGPAKGQALVLSILAGREILSQRELQQMLGIQPGSLSELVSKLEGKGYLIREKAEDRRGNLLRITDEGRRAIPTVDEVPEDDPFAALSLEQQDQLAALLRTLLTQWADAMVAAGPRDRHAPIPHRNRPVEL